MTQLVHLGTTIQSHFGLVDDDGNVIPQPPIPAQLGVFSAEEFRTAFEGIRDARDASLAAFDQTLTAPNRATRRAAASKRPKPKPLAS